MQKSFYHFLLKYRQPKISDELSRFSNEVYRDHSFPKQSTDYNEISDYLELSGEYGTSMAVFDSVWNLYIETEEKS